ncbi:DNA polymerase IV [Nocardioides sp. CPCC 205120]|uniref:DNA polymerase IV n=1 Tax=Nocardioides sp. CPCC 205120 TaxID=3406462 RepID=UPI003B50933E
MRPAPQPGDDAGCGILHVDMDAFYASVVLRDHPELRRAPVVVAGGGDRGVVLCATYPARRSGVGAGMPTARARRLCPDLVVVRPDFAAFAEVSTAVFALFESVTPHVEPLSQEEAFLDVRGARRTATPLELAGRLRERVWREQRITCSVGIAATRPVAKLASRRAKPDGVAVIAPDRVREVLDPLDVGDLWGVGPATRARLAQIGLETVGDVRAAPVDLLRSRLGDSAGRHVHALVRGDDTARSSPGFVRRERPRSIGADRTLGRDLGDRDAVLAEALRLTVEVTSRLRRAGLAARTVGLRLRYPDFTTVSRSRTLVEPTTTTREATRRSSPCTTRSGAGRGTRGRCASSGCGSRSSWTPGRGSSCASASPSTGGATRTARWTGCVSASAARWSPRPPSCGAATGPREAGAAGRGPIHRVRLPRSPPAA